MLIHIPTNLTMGLVVTGLQVSQTWDRSEKHVKTLKTADD